jgi:hypothetical protein
VVSIRHLLKGDEIVHLGTDEGEMRAGSPDDDRRPRKDSQTLTVRDGQRANGHDLAVVNLDDHTTIEEGVPTPKAWGQRGDSVSFHEGAVGIQVKQSGPGTHEQHRCPTYPLRHRTVPGDEGHSSTAGLIHQSQLM